MKFKSKSEFLNWVSARYLSDEIAYVKNINQEIIFATSLAMSKLNIISGQRLYDCTALIANVTDIIKIEELIIKNNSKMVVVENWHQGSIPKILMWTKRHIIIDDQNYFLIEEYINSNFAIKKLLINSTAKVTNHLDNNLLDTFTHKEKIILYLLIHNFSITEIATYLFISNSTIKTYLYRHIASKFKNYGFEISSKEQITKVATLLGFGIQVPEELFNKLLTITLALNSSLNGDNDAKFF
jgi:hypothetical protein